MLFFGFPQKAWKGFWEKVLSDRISLILKLDTEMQISHWHMIVDPVNSFIDRVRKLINGISSIGFDLVEVADTLKGSSSKVLDLAIKTELQSAHSIESMNEMSSAIAKISENTTAAASSLLSLNERTVSAEQDTESGVKTIESLSENILKWADSNRELAASVSRIGKTVQVINYIADQTRMIAFNAAMEAINAGEVGKRFRVVAEEVRDLASKTALATKEIDVCMQTIIENTENSSNNMEATLQQVAMSIKKTKDVDALLKEFLKEVSQIASNVNGIALGIDEQTRVSESVLSAASEVAVFAGNTKEVAKEMDSISNTVISSALRLNDNLCVVKKDNFEESVEQALIKHAAELKAIIEECLLEKEIGMDDLFDEHYVPISGKKFRAKFDDFFESFVLPNIRIWSKSNDRFIYVVVMDRNGYMPVHLNEARVGIIMTDDISLGGATGTTIISRAFKRPKEAGGELVNDVSCPLVIQGRHWGCLRIGYLPLME